MPGIFGYVSRKDTPIPRNTVGIISNQLQKEKKHFRYKISDFHLLGGITHESSPAKISLAHNKEKTVTAISIGNIYNKKALCKKFNIKYSSAYLNSSSFIIDLYGNNLDFKKYLNGLFCVAIHNSQKGTTSIFNDRYSFYPLYYYVDREKLIFAPTAKIIFSDPLVRPQLNEVALPEFFTFSCILEDETFFKNVKSVMPATEIIYDKNLDKIKMRKYWDLSVSKYREPSYSLLLNDFKRLLSKAVEIRVQDLKEVGIFLSGGMDSRLLTAFANQTDVDVITFTMGERGCIQQKIAKQVAEVLGIENVFYEIPSDFIANFSEEIVNQADGLARIRESHFIALLNKIRKKVSTVLIGTFGESLFGHNMNKEVLSLEKNGGIHNFDKIKDYLWKRCVRGLSPKEYQNAFDYQLAEKYLKLLRTHFDRLADKIFCEKKLDSVCDLIDYWDYRVRETTVRGISCQYMDWYLETRHPFLDTQLVDYFMFKLPANLRLDRIFIQQAMNYYFPSLSRIPLEQSNAPPDAGMLEEFFGKFSLFIRRRVRLLIEKISRGKIIIKTVDYRDYNNWLRTGSRVYVERILLNPVTLQRGFFKGHYVQRIMREHMTSIKNHDQLICDLINFELLNRFFLEQNRPD
jgi:asparagine synthase (glutamine-hydrolysing)